VCAADEVCTKPYGCIEQCEAGFQHCSPQGPCVACCSNGDCPAPDAACASPVCDELGACRVVIDPNSCLIDSVCFTNGATNPANACQTCDPASNPVGWTNRTPGTVCGDTASCTDGMLTPAQTCNEMGQCVTFEPVSCGRYLCDENGAACMSTCTSDEHCLASAHCDDGACLDDSGLGVACDGDGDCLSGHCAATATGALVCCDTACDGTCHVCGVDGACGPASNLPCDADGGSTCCNGACVDLNSDTAYCGSCDIACDASTNPCLVSVCADGACTYAPDDGVSCSSGNACQQDEFCLNGICGNGEPVVCDSENPCIIDSCDPSVGCVQEMKIAGSSCDDGNLCNGSEVCDGAGNCTPGTPVVCHPSDQCHGIGVCDPATGLCSDPPLKLNGTPCNDSNYSTCNDVCRDGVCSGTPTNFITDPYNCGGCGRSCPAWTGNSSAICSGGGGCCIYTSAGQACCQYGSSRPSVCSVPCGTYQCNCYTYSYSCGRLNTETCYGTSCSTCTQYCDYPCCV
jgi:hypothetical protein